MIALGVDPGPQKTAWAILDIPPTGSAGVLGCGVVDNPLGWEDMATAGDDLPLGIIKLVAVERPDFRPIGGRSNPAQSLAMARALVQTAWVGGELAGRMAGHGFNVVDPLVTDIRRAITGKPTATDALVKVGLSAHVALPKRSNNHERDAMAAALVGAWMVAREAA